MSEITAAEIAHALTDETGATLPTNDEVRAYYRARTRAEKALGALLAGTLRREDLSQALRHTIEIWFKFHPECRPY